MEFIEAFKTVKRMCDIEHCLTCPLSEDNNKTKESCCDFIIQFPEKAEEILTKWAEEHPVKTMLQDFLEKYPNAPLEEEYGAPNVCVFNLGYIKERDCGNYDYSCKKCWNRQMED